MTAPRQSPEEIATAIIRGAGVQPDEAAVLIDAPLNWLRRRPLYECCLCVLAMFMYDHTRITGEITGLLARRLIATEQAPGGPYRSGNPDDDLMTNAVIGQLFRAFGTPLPNVEAYVRAQATLARLTVTDPTKAWVLSWPYNLQATQRRSTTRAAAAPDTATMAAKMVTKRIDAMSIHTRTAAIAVWQRITKADTRHEISGLSAAFAQSLRLPVPGTVNTRLLDEANCYAWMAYTLYDGLIDDEERPECLPAANIAHRLSFATFQSAARTKRGRAYVTTSFDAMDAAQGWELAACRFAVTGNQLRIGTLPRYRMGRALFERAGAHALGPLLVLDHISGITTRQYRMINRGLAEYIIARQLNDDMHDWKDDLAHGHISYVVAYLLRKTNLSSDTYLLANVDDRLKQYFWSHGSEELLAITQSYVTRAYDHFLQSDLLTEHSPFFAMTLDPIQASIDQATIRLTDQKEFLRAYSDGDNQA